MQKSLVLCVMLLCQWAFTSAQANNMSTACADLKRPNIDCACVGDRIDAYLSNTESSAVKKLIIQRYANAIGNKNDLQDAMTATMSNPSEMMSTQMAYDRLGGLPESIEDYERGCVVKTSNTIQFGELEEGSAAASYLDAQVKSIGESQRRYALCSVNRMSRYLSDAEIQAYQLSFSYYEGDSSNDDTASRAKKMGLPRSEFEQLEKSARNKLSQNSELDANYCSAITYAEAFSDERIERDQQQEAARFAAAPRTKSQATSSASGPQAQANRIMQSSCEKQGKSPQYCQCVMQDFQTKVVQRSPSADVTLAWTVMRHGSEMNANEMMNLMMQAKPQDQQAAAQLMMATPDVGEKCLEQSAPAAQLAGDPRARMMTICMADVEDTNICNCMVDKMRGNLNDDDFELVVDLREADYQGADDPIAVVAKDRGLTRAQAEQALGNNKGLIGGMMNMDMLSCVGGLPDMSQLPQMQGQ